MYLCFSSSSSDLPLTLINLLQAEEFSSRIQKLSNQGSASDRQLMGPGSWMS